MEQADVAEASQQFLLAAERSTTLYQLAEDYVQLMDRLEDPDADTAAIEAELDRIEGTIAHKAEAIGGLIKWYEGLADLRKAEAKRMADSVGRFEKQAERLRDYTLRQMQAMNMTRIETSRFSLTLRQNPPRVEILEAMMIPSEFNRTRITIEPDKKLILEHTKTTGELVPGTDIVRGTRLEIK